MSTSLTHADEFFATARERYRIKLARDAGMPWPWTTNPILQEWRFTNVHREDDRTTVWFRKNLRNPLSQSYDVVIPTTETYNRLKALTKIVEATLIFRWFNRIETGEIIKDLILFNWDTNEARRRLEGVSPVVTGAYIIKAGDGVSKLDGILDCIDEALPQLPSMVGKWGRTLRGAWEDLKTLHFMGPFMAYEVITDLRHTPVLNQAVDIMTWGNLGPGAIRGIGRVVANDPELFANSRSGQKQMLGLMAELLGMSQQEQYWPQEWPKWEMHEVEMWLCEYAKYCNGKEGQRLKRRYSV